jgi:hypothetical protein
MRRRENHWPVSGTRSGCRMESEDGDVTVRQSRGPKVGVSVKVGGREADEICRPLEGGTRSGSPSKLTRGHGRLYVQSITDLGRREFAAGARKRPFIRCRLRWAAPPKSASGKRWERHPRGSP